MKRAWDLSLLGSVIFRLYLKVNPFHCYGLWMKSTLFLLELNSIRQIIKDDKVLVREDWQECICPLLSLEHLNLNPVFFGLEQYLAAKSLIASRSFQIDDYHGYGMVPLSDLFNHKTGAEDVHFTSGLESDSESENSNIDMQDDSSVVDEDVSSDDNRSESPLVQDDNTALEMIMVKDVKAGTEVFNTYGLLGNAALLHRYGFTESDNPFDIVNVDLDLVLQWSCSLYSKRHSRARLSLWRKLGHSSCSSQNSEYFEISSDGIPQIELLILLYVMLLSDKAYEDLDHMLSTGVTSNESLSFLLKEQTDNMEDVLLSVSVRNGLLLLADMRESAYGSNSIEDDVMAMRTCCSVKERKVYHSMMLRICERKILQKLRSYANRNDRSRKRGRN
ncbi:N-lysine methyltransferase setd6 isoform X2 [Impatiens glandulifera]|uniref:N-lysine methyltransferase setd6 isoform X2 n=1 Tax=Impatiens glandulifera TaxID=253017 RepID=UPI001FB0AF43|nr:N-lysine methyltransferase setd6 isoform X2 [Impatiens glandulifera]